MTDADRKGKAGATVPVSRVRPLIVLAVILGLADAIFDFFFWGSASPEIHRALALSEAGAVGILIYLLWLAVRSGRAFEDALGLTHARLGVVLEAAPLSLFLLDPAGRFTLAEGCGLKKIGLKPQDLIQRDFSEVLGGALLDTDDGETLRIDEVEQKVLEGGTVQGEINLGEVRLFTRLTPYRDPGGAGMGLLGVFLDVTDLKKAEEAAKRTARLYQEVVERSPIGFLRASNGGEILQANPALATMLGYADPVDLMRIPMEEIWVSDGQRDALREAHSTHTDVTDFEVQWKRRDGRRIWVSLTTFATALSGDGQIVMDGFVRDVTSRKESVDRLRNSEERFRRIFEESPIGLAAIDADLRLAKVNRSFRDLMGRSEDELLGLDLMEITHPEDRRESQRLVRRLLRKEVSRFQIEKRYLRGNGESIWASTSVALIPAPEGGRPEVLGMVEDISARKKAQDEIRHSREQLRRLTHRLQAVREEERARVAREIHDELGQLLSVVKMDLQNARIELTRGEVSPTPFIDEAIHNSEMVMDAVRRIVNELRPPELDDLGLQAAVADLVEDFQRHSGIRADSEFASDFPPLTTDEANAFFRIVQEALTNVVRHANASRVLVSFMAPPGEIRLEVRDNGIGVREDSLSTSQGFGRLSMRERMIALGGDLEIRDHPSGGTMVRARVPRTHTQT